MRRFWWDGLGFCFGALLSVGAVYALSEAVDPVYPEMRTRVSLFRARADQVEVVNVGNSHAMAIDFVALGAEGMHFWTEGLDPFEAAHLVRYAARRAPGLRYVLLTTSYGFERLDNAALTSRDYTGIRRGMYLRTGDPDVIAGDRELWLGALFAPVARPDQWSVPLARLLGRRQPVVRHAPDGRRLLPPPPPITPDSLARHARWQAELHRARTAESLANAPRTPDRAAESLEALARELGERGVVLVLYTPPFHAAFLRELSPDLVEGTRRALRPVLRHENVVWLDFATDPAFAGRDDLFKDSDHLNPEGARVFSSLLGQRMAALGGGRYTHAPTAAWPRTTSRTRR